MFTITEYNLQIIFILQDIKRLKGIEIKQYA